MISRALRHCIINQTSRSYTTSTTKQRSSTTRMSGVKYNNNNVNRGPRPNYFLGLQIDNQAIIDQLKQIQNHIGGRVPDAKKSIIAIEKLHLTLFVMTLDDVPTQLALIKTLLPQAKTLMNETFDNVIPSSSIVGIGSFNDRVIWAGLKEDDKSKLTVFYGKLLKLFQDNNIQVEDRWSPHITLAKGQKDGAMLRATKESERFKDQDFGIQQFNSLQLMRIGSTNKQTGYYDIIDSINF
ncbi:hypothetical protein DFA_00598 [Cavenderia fasciculata]|uniref:A-kinase anchor protein 7-like phosphoesterase domain-containing protein n=1 Tax=Cavenderia fasciculata TaxID=261658 RepID=F4PSP3_CACFS|nr:uncharacterized protein DFA_00598 [Cavenderia fasciculata]EGG20735.1 hypothetical protein DFA_00598 [Cavenderia fasciculata]|eukprot:XP_004358585.1 hypothetical protein DFA_00598 [Cavenderia fasciculata]